MHAAVIRAFSATAATSAQLTGVCPIIPFVGDISVPIIVVSMAARSSFDDFENCRNTGFCSKGDSCEYSHGIFEARLHPDSFRTVQCKDGAKCRRKICFFYHGEDERRTPTGLHEARAQITAELGESAFDLTGDQLRAGVNPVSWH